MFQTKPSDRKKPTGWMIPVCASWPGGRVLAECQDCEMRRTAPQLGDILKYLNRRRVQAILAFCSTHVRRESRKLAYSSPSQPIFFRRIATLYATKHQVRGTFLEQRRVVRAKVTRIMVDDLDVYLEVWLPKASARAMLANAIRYDFPS